MNNDPNLPHRSAAEAMVMNPPEPTKEKEKQGFFRAIKKKKKKTQVVRSFNLSLVISSRTPAHIPFGMMMFPLSI